MGSQSTSHVRSYREINGRHALCIIFWMEIASSLLYRADCIIRPMTANPFHYGLLPSKAISWSVSRER